MKPPRVFAKAGYFWVSYYLPGQKNDVRKSTHLELDIQAGTGDWWKKSKHKTRIQQVLKAIEEERYAKLMGIHWGVEEEKKPVSLSEVLAEYNTANTASSGVLSDQTLRRRAHSVSQVELFNKGPLTLGKVDTKWIAGFRKWMTVEPQEFTEWTRHTIISDLKSLFAFARKKKYIDDDPMAEVKNPQPQTIKMHTEWEDELKFFGYMYFKHPDYFVMLATERFGGFRFSDVLAMETSQIDLRRKMFVKTRNVKMNREELHPISDVLLLIYQHVWKPGKVKAFPQVTLTAVSKAIKKCCVALDIKNIPTHQLKANYAHELDEIEMQRHVFKMLMHHKDQDVSARYTGKNQKLLAKVLNQAQERWMPEISQLLQTARSDKEYLKRY